MTDTKLTDTRLLCALLRSEDLTDDERRAFGDMLTKMEERGVTSLSKDQRVWAESVYKRYRLADQQGAENLFSSGKVKKGTGPAVTYPWEKGGRMAHPTRPPGRA